MSGSAPLVAPSLLAADVLCFAEEIKSAEAAGADWHHLDVMDGHFVPNLSFGLPLVKAAKRVAAAPVDVHIMISNPDEFAIEYVKAGADSLSFHIEAAKHPHRILQAIRAAGAKAGVALNPGTPIDVVFPLLSQADLVTVMSVNPGFGGQQYIHQTGDRVKRLTQEIDRQNLVGKVDIEVDGGINAETGRLVVDAGATVLVAGTYVYGAEDRAAAIAALKS